MNIRNKLDSNRRDISEKKSEIKEINDVLEKGELVKFYERRKGERERNGTIPDNP